MGKHQCPYQNGNAHVEMGMHFYFSPHFKMGITVLKWGHIDAYFKMGSVQSITHFKMEVVLIWEIMFWSPF
jgi:hypothetical protein